MLRTENISTKYGTFVFNYDPNAPQQTIDFQRQMLLWNYIQAQEIRLGIRRRPRRRRPMEEGSV